MKKTCSHCNESVRAEARKCQFCNFRFDVTPAVWPYHLGVLGAVLLGGAAVFFALALAGLALPAAFIALPKFLLAIGGVMLTIGTLGARANRRKRFRRTGSVPALRASDSRALARRQRPLASIPLAQA